MTVRMSECVTCCIIRALGFHGAAMETRSEHSVSRYTRKARNSLMNRENISGLGKMLCWNLVRFMLKITR